MSGRVLRLRRKMSTLAFPSPVASTLSTEDGLLFPVRRVYCIGRNYALHAAEMHARHQKLGMADDAAAPAASFFYFQKPSYGAVIDTSVTPTIPYPPATSLLEFECEMVVGLSEGAELYYGVGCDLTRRDAQNVAKEKRRPWEEAKSFDASAPCGPLRRAANVSKDAVLKLEVNGEIKQQSSLDLMIFDVEKSLEQIGRQVKLLPGDLLFTGTPAGVGPVQPGDALKCSIVDPKTNADVVPPCYFTIGQPC